MSDLRRYRAIWEGAARRALIAGTLAAGACTEAAGPAGSGDATLPETPARVSAPLGAPGTAPGVHSLRRGAGLVYIAMVAGSEPLGERAEIRVLGQLDPVIVPILDGGLDPVPLPAEPGDTIEVRVVRPTGQVVAGYRRVPRSSRPTVVRVSPANRRTAVPLNSIVRVVFSEPMDSASVVAALRLTTDGVPVPATVTLTGGLTADLTPAGPLAANTTYQVELDPSARSVGNAAIGTTSAWEFITVAPGTPLPPADTTGPVITLLSPTPGQVLSAEFPIFRVNMADAGPIAGVLWTLLDAPSEELEYVLTAQGGPTPPTYTYSALLTRTPGPGTFTFRIQAYDSVGNEGILEPTVTLVASDPTPRIVVRSFEMIEYQYLPSLMWYYAPQLTVADAPGGGGLEILGFELLSGPGLPTPWARVAAWGRTVPPGQDVALFMEVYGDWELSFGAYDGSRASGDVTARLVYRDVNDGHVYATTLTGPIVRGDLPTTYNGGCGHWYAFVSPGSCPWVSSGQVRHASGGLEAPWRLHAPDNARFSRRGIP